MCGRALPRPRDHASEMDPTSANHFDRSKPFYPLVVNHLVTLHGFIELASRHAMRTATAWVEPAGPHTGPAVLSISGEPVTDDRLRDFWDNCRCRGS